MSADTEAFTVTIKFGGGFEAPWVVLRGQSISELIEQLRLTFDLSDITNTLSDVILAANGAAQESYALSLLGSSGLVKTTPPQDAKPPAARETASRPPLKAVPEPSRQPDPPDVAGEVDEGQTCKHGARTYKESTTVHGEWKRWECALPYSQDNKRFRCKAVNA